MHLFLLMSTNVLQFGPNKFENIVPLIIIIINYSIYKAHFTEKEKHSKAPVKFCQDVGKKARISVF